MNVTRRGFLAGSAALGTLGGAALARAGSAQDKLLVVVVANGGWDPTFVFDPKYHVAEIDGPEKDDAEGVEGTETWGGIQIAANPMKRPSVSAWFERWHTRACVVNGVWMGSISHDPCRVRILTGAPDATRPDLATISGYQLGGAMPLGSVDLSGWSLSGPLASSSGRLGANSQLKVLIDPNTTLSAPRIADFKYPIWRMQAQDEDAVAAWMRARTERFRQARGLDGGENDRLLDDLGISMDRATRFRDQSASILDRLTLGTSASLEEQIFIAADLLEGGLCQAVTLDSRRLWDTHDNNASQHGFYNDLFLALDVLASTFDERGLLDRTVVAVVSEMGRTPKLNASAGKDHWGHTSALLFGAVRGDVQLGGTDDAAEAIAVDLESGAPDPAGAYCKYDNFVAGVLDMLGVDSDPWLPGVVPWRGAKA